MFTFRKVLVSGDNDFWITQDCEIKGFRIVNLGNANNHASIEITDTKRSHNLTLGGLSSDFCAERPFWFTRFGLPFYQAKEGTRLNVNVTEYGSVGTVSYCLELYADLVPVRVYNERKPQFLGFPSAIAVTSGSSYANYLELPDPFYMSGIQVIHTINVSNAKTVNQSYRLTLTQENQILPPLFNDVSMAMLVNNSSGINLGAWSLMYAGVTGYLLEKKVNVTFRDLYGSYPTNTSQIAIVNLVGTV